MRTSRRASGRPGGASRGGASIAALSIVVVLLAVSSSLSAGRPTARAPPVAAAGALSEPSRSAGGGGRSAIGAFAAPEATLAPPAVVTPRWVNVTASTAGVPPPAGVLGAMAYDPLLHATLYFGGCTAAVCPDAQTWIQANGTWRNATSTYPGPSPRLGASVDYDANMGGVLLFGGSTASLSELNDTWLFGADGWTNLTASSAAAPSPREYASMAFDPAPGENGSVLFGGYVGGVGYVNDTWVWERGAGWVPLSPSAPPPTTGRSQMTYDPLDDAVVLFGCGYGCGSPNQTFELYDGQWWSVAGTGPVPAYRYNAAMTFDPSVGAVVMFGGWGFAGALRDTWAFANGTWSNLSASVGPAPPGRWMAAMSGESGSFPPLLFGGSSTFYLNGALRDTWVLETAPGLSVAAAPLTAELSAPVTFTVSVSGGSAPYRAIVAFGDGSNETVAFSGTTAAIAHRYRALGSYPTEASVTDAAGALASIAATPTVQVTGGPTLPTLNVPAFGDVGLALSFPSQSPAGGTGPYHSLWRFGDGATAAGANATHAYRFAGTYDGNLTVTDADGAWVVAPFSVTIAPTPSVNVTADAQAVAGTVWVARAIVSGGTPVLTVAWRLSDGSSSALPDVSRVFASGGTYTAQVWVNDSVGGRAVGSTTVSVVPHTGIPTPTPSSGAAPPVPSWFWPSIGGVVLVGVVGSALLIRRGRARP